jgi:outer membrane biosynthesis protein TonB
MNDTTLGIIAAAVPLIIIGFFALRRLPWIFAFFVALVAVGIGYLTTTDTIKEYGHKVRTTLPAGIIPEHKKAEESAPPEGGAMKALPPPAEQTPAPTPPAAESAPTPPATPAPEANPPSPPPAAEPAPAAPAPQPDNSATPPAAPTPAPANP